MKSQIALAISLVALTGQAADIDQIPDLFDTSDDAVNPENMEDVIDTTPMPNLEDHIYIAKEIWLGMFQGLYGMGRQVEKPTEDCFGSWIPEKLRFMHTFERSLVSDFWTVTFEDAQTFAYDSIDLMFLNDQYCHFRATMWDVKAFCSQEGKCGFGTMLDNM